MYFKKALEILKKVYVDGEYVGDAMRILGEEDKSIVTRIVYGVLERDTELDYYIRNLTQKAPKKVISVILKMGIYSFIYMDSLPNYAVCDKLVELTKSIGKRELASFVNAVLKRATKEKIPLPEKKEERLSVLSSTPLWIVKKILRQYKENAEKILFAEGERDSHVRCNSLLYSKEEFQEELKKRKIEFKESECGFYVKGTSEIRDLFDSGKITYQSPCSMIIATIASKGSKKILDVCSAPGGKSVYMYELTKGQITSCDLHEHRVALIKSYAKRMRAKISALKMDARVFTPEFEKAFDSVLCDVPCSGIGVRYSKPDTLINRQESDIPELVKMQEEIIQTSSRYVKEGGKLVYSTCTIFNEENERVVQRFLANNSDFYVEEEIKMIPGINSKEGFYAVAIRRK